MMYARCVRGGVWRDFVSAEDSKYALRSCLDRSSQNAHVFRQAQAPFTMRNASGATGLLKDLEINMVMVMEQAIPQNVETLSIALGEFNVVYRVQPYCHRP